MAPERGKQIREIAASALDVRPEERSSFLGQACSGDAELHREVERVLGQMVAIGEASIQSLERTRPLGGGEIVANRYRILSLIGRGGMGEVYAAEDGLLHEVVALKTLRADIDQDEGAVRRFQKEIQLARKVTHPNVCRVFDAGLHQFSDLRAAPLLFFTMELLEGETLFARIRSRERLAREEVFPIAIQIAEGLEAAHAAGIVHRDFKSGNVILAPAAGGERAVITDFGLARGEPGVGEGDETHTLSGRVRIAGTLGYMSPEQLSGGAVTAASDIYSFGIVLFEMATGQLPFDNRHPIHAAMQRASGEGIAVRSLAPDIDPRWEGAIIRCLQKDPARRFRSAGEAAGWLRAAGWRIPPRYWTRRDWTRAIGSAGVASAAAGGLWLQLGRPYRPPPAASEWYEKGVAALHSMTYEAARKALEQAVAADPRFALAHASLARSYDELDYSDLAKDSMLRAAAAARDSRLARSDDLKLRALQLLISRDYDRAMPLFRELERAAGEREKAAAVLESGWVAQQRDDTGTAATLYQRALQLDAGYAAAKLRLGYILGRRGGKDDLGLALNAFSEAEKLYGSSSDYEGMTETLLQRAQLLNRRSRAAEAMPIIEQALAIARTVGNRYQQIRLQMLAGVAARNLGETGRAADLARQAIDAAVTERMDNLATSGLVDLGNSFLVRRDLRSAEPIFHRALDLARRGKVRRYEARALLSLGSLCEQDQRPEEAKKFIEAGLPFYRQAGYRREFIQATGLLGGVHEQLAEYKEGIRILREALTSAVQLQDPAQAEALIRERLGDNLRGLSAWPEALAEYERAAGLIGTSIQGADARLNLAQLYAWLGRGPDAERSLLEAQRWLEQSADKQHLPEFRERQAEIAYMDGRLDAARDAARQGLALPDLGGEARLGLSFLEALVLIRRGIASGAALAERVAARYEEAKLIGNAAAARLSIAEAWMAAGTRDRARELARQALEFFEPRQIPEPRWRGHVVAGWASPDRTEGIAHAAAAHAALDQLRHQWPPAVVDHYLHRPDLERLLRLARFHA